MKTSTSLALIIVVSLFCALFIFSHARAFDVVVDGQDVDLGFVTEVCLSFNKPKDPHFPTYDNSVLFSRQCYRTWNESYINTGVDTVLPIITFQVCEARQSVMVPHRERCSPDTVVDVLVID